MEDRLPQVLKNYSKRLAKLNQNVLEMKHYWKIRCAERKTFTEKSKQLILVINRMKYLEGALGNLLSRKYLTIRSYKQHKDKRDNRCYPLFISRQEMMRLRRYLSYSFKARYVKSNPGKLLPWLNRSEYHKLTSIIKMLDNKGLRKFRKVLAK